MKIPKFMKPGIQTVILCLILSFGASCRNSSDKNQADTQQPVILSPEELNAEFKIIKVEDGFGYDIYVNGEAYIHQPHIPAVNGNHPFKTEADAQKVAGLVIQKIEGNIIPPSVSAEELSVMGIAIE